MGQGFNSPRLHHLRFSTAQLQSNPALMHLAVYGSLLRAEGMLTTLGVVDRLRFVATAKLPGRLFDLGDFPGLLIPSMEVSREGPFVLGELFEVIDPAVWKILDDYEGWNPRSPAESPFIRREIKLIQPPLDAWVYVLNRSVTGCPEVVSLSWPEYKARRAATRGTA